MLALVATGGGGWRLWDCLLRLLSSETLRGGYGYADRILHQWKGQKDQNQRRFHIGTALSAAPVQGREDDVMPPECDMYDDERESVDRTIPDETTTVPGECR